MLVALHSVECFGRPGREGLSRPPLPCNATGAPCNATRFGPTRYPHHNHRTSQVGRAPMTSRKVVIAFFTASIGRHANIRTPGIILSIFALAVLLCHVRSALATTYYVSATGSDTNSGTSTTAPFLTIQKAANLTQPGDTVNVMNGT